MPGKTITYKDATMAMKTVAAYMKDKEKGGTIAKKNTYAEAKAKDPKLDEYIKARDAARKSGDKSAQNAAQNKINAAYGQGPTDRPVTPKDNKVMQNQENKDVKTSKEKGKEKADAATKVPAGPGKAPEKKPMDKAMEAIEAGDKKAAKESGLEGKLKRVAKRQAGKVKREKKRTEREKEKEAMKKQVDQLKSVATRDESPAMYFKQKIKYNNSAKDVAIRVAADEKDKKHASAKGKKALDHDISSMISHANYGKTMSNYGKRGKTPNPDTMTNMNHGMTKRMKSATMDGGQVSAKDPSAPAKQLKKLGGSVLSKHFKRNR